eukprot:436205-Alexandrium_andersonii.AAC.1
MEPRCDAGAGSAQSRAIAGGSMLESAQVSGLWNLMNSGLLKGYSRACRTASPRSRTMPVNRQNTISLLA